MNLYKTWIQDWNMSLVYTFVECGFILQVI